MSELYEHPYFRAAMQMERRIRAALPLLREPLGAYRKWLDAGGIESERDGWPTDAALDVTNIDRFIASRASQTLSATA